MKLDIILGGILICEILLSVLIELSEVFVTISGVWHIMLVELEVALFE